jgi:hypothetical protein
MPGTVLLFLGSDPALAERLAASPQTLSWVGRFLPANLVHARASRTDPEAEGPFPPEQVMSAQRLIDLAKRAHRSVRVVDVNRPGPDLALVQRYVTAADVLPIAVRADGTKLVGGESFERSALRAFLAAA